MLHLILVEKDDTEGMNVLIAVRLNTRHTSLIFDLKASLIQLCINVDIERKHNKIVWSVNQNVINFN